MEALIQVMDLSRKEIKTVFAKNYIVLHKKHDGPISLYPQWSHRYFDWSLCLEAHILHFTAPGNNKW